MRHKVVENFTYKTNCNRTWFHYPHTSYQYEIIRKEQTGQINMLVISNGNWHSPTHTNHTFCGVFLKGTHTIFILIKTKRNKIYNYMWLWNLRTSTCILHDKVQGFVSFYHLIELHCKITKQSHQHTYFATTLKFDNLQTKTYMHVFTNVGVVKKLHDPDLSKQLQKRRDR